MEHVIIIREYMQAQKIAELNDDFRRSFKGGRVVFTSGVQQLGDDVQQELFKQVREYYTFDSNNDPYNEHDFGVIALAQHKFFWKIDYYDLKYRCLSPDPTNSELTNRVMTIMLAEEY